MYFMPLLPVIHSSFTHAVSQICPFSGIFWVGHICSDRCFTSVLQVGVLNPLHDSLCFLNVDGVRRINQSELLDMFIKPMIIEMQ